MAVGIYMDVHIPRAITNGLRLRDVDVLTAQRMKRLLWLMLNCSTGQTNWAEFYIRRTMIFLSKRTLDLNITFYFPA
jgi:hypothetical protein